MRSRTLSYAFSWFAVLVAVLHCTEGQPQIKIPLYYDHGGRYIATASMSYGRSKQLLNLTITTSIGAVVVTGRDFSDDGKLPFYNMTASTTEKLVDNSTGFIVLDGVTNSTLVKETCTLLTAGGPAVSYRNQTVIVVNHLYEDALLASLHSRLGIDISGFLGLGTNQLRRPSGQSAMSYPSFEDSLAGQYFIESSQSRTFFVGFALAKPVIHAQPSSDSGEGPPSPYSGAPAGVLRFFDTDPDDWLANISWAAVTTADTLGSPSAVQGVHSSVPLGDWSFVPDGWEFDNLGNALQRSGPIPAAIDPLYPGIYLPRDLARLIYASIPGSLTSNMSTLGNLSQAWTVPCTSKFSFSLLIGQRNFTLDESTLVIDQGLGENTCVSGLEQWTDPSDAMYLFGSRFLSTVYVILRIASDGTQEIGFASTTASRDSFVFSVSASPNHSPPSDHGVIIGGAVGGAALVLMSAIGFLYVYCCCQNKQRAAAELRRKQTEVSEAKRTLDTNSPAFIEPFTMMSPSSVQSYNGRYPDAPPARTPSPVTSSPHSEGAVGVQKRPPPTSYKFTMNPSVESAVPERIYSTHGHISLSSSSANESIQGPQTPISITPTMGSHYNGQGP